MKQWFKTKLKQLWVPAAFRLPEPEFTEEQLSLLEELIQLIHPSLSKVEMANKDEKLHMAHFLVDLGTGIWRIRRKIEGMSRMPKEISDALYSLESTWASMSEGGVEIIDHIGTVPTKNEAKIVEVRDIPNLTREQVVDTIKPTILLHGEVIQIGEVVMGRPVRGGAASPTPVPQAATIEETTCPAESEAVLAPPPPDEAPQELVDEPTVTHEVETLTLDVEPPIEEIRPAKSQTLAVAEERPEPLPQPAEELPGANAALDIEAVETETPVIGDIPDEGVTTDEDALLLDVETEPAVYGQMDLGMLDEASSTTIDEETDEMDIPLPREPIADEAPEAKDLPAMGDEKPKSKRRPRAKPKADESVVDGSVDLETPIPAFGKPKIKRTRHKKGQGGMSDDG